MPHCVHAHLHQVFSTTTPVPLGDGGGSRTEANVALYNAAALAVLPPAVIINDLHGDIVAFCGKPSSSWLCARIFCPIQFQDNELLNYDSIESIPFDDCSSLLLLHPLLIQGLHHP